MARLLPPLNALRAFEAAPRPLSFTNRSTDSRKSNIGLGHLRVHRFAPLKPFNSCSRRCRKSGSSVARRSGIRALRDDLLVEAAEEGLLAPREPSALAGKAGNVVAPELLCEGLEAIEDRAHDGAQRVEPVRPVIIDEYRLSARRDIRKSWRRSRTRINCGSGTHWSVSACPSTSPWRSVISRR